MYNKKKARSKKLNGNIVSISLFEIRRSKKKNLQRLRVTMRVNYFQFGEAKHQYLTEKARHYRRR